LYESKMPSKYRCWAFHCDNKKRLLQSQQYLSFTPQFLQRVVIALVGREEMDDHIAKIHDLPAVVGLAFLFAFSAMFFADVLDHSVGECIQHAVTGACADHKKVGKDNHFLKIQKDNIFSLFVFQGVHNFTGKFERIQISPLGLDG
jgi:hypothetical protein